MPDTYQRNEEEFEALNEREEKTEEILATLKEAGLRGDMKRREELTDMLDDYAEPFNPYGDEYEEDLDRQTPRSFAPPGYAKNSYASADDDDL